MNMTKLLLALSVVMAIASTTTAYAEAPITITLGGTQHVFDDDQDIDNELLPSAAIEYRFGQNWASELTYSLGEADAVDGSQDVDVDSWHLGFLRYLKNKDSLYPYLAFGGGELIRGFNNGDASDRQLNAGGGFRYYFTDRWSWRADARWLHAPDDSTNDVAVTFGISYSFAPPPGLARPMAAKPVEPAAVLDSDGDGAADDMDACPNSPAGARVGSRGCTVVVSKVASIKLRVNFDFDSSDVQEYYFAEIEDLAEFLRRFEDLTVDLEGHTDSRGDKTYNQGLSQRRANAVRELLVNEYGIAGSRLKVAGYGETHPIASNDTDAGRAENRRVMATLEVEYEE